MYILCLFVNKDTLKQKQGKKMAKKKKRLSKAGKLILDVIMVAALGVAGYSGYQIYSETKEDRDGAAAYEDMRNQAAKSAEGIIDFTEEEVGIDWDYLRSVNEDIAGWIRLDDSVIDYPFVYSPDNSFYLRKLMDGTYNKNGTIFVDYRNQKYFQDRVTVLYGHHMHSGAMFADIEKYKEPGYYESHKVIQIFTPDQNYEMRPIAGYVTTGTSNYIRISFENDEDYLNYVQGICDRSAFQSEDVVNAEDKIILISTCSYDVKDGRFVMIGKLVPVNGAN